MLKRLAVVIIIVFAVLAALSELVLPGVFARGVEEALATTFGDASSYDVTLTSRPAIKMLIGKLDEVSVVSTNVATSSMVLESLAVTLEDTSIDLKSLLAERELRWTRTGTSKVSITITERNLEDYLSRNVPEFREPRVLMTDDGMSLSGYVVVFGQDIVFDLDGRFEVTDDQNVGFEVTGFNVDDVSVPVEFLEKWLDVVGNPDLSLDMESFPLPLKATEILHEDGRVIIKGSGG